MYIYEQVITSKRSCTATQESRQIFNTFTISFTIFTGITQSTSYILILVAFNFSCMGLVHIPGKISRQLLVLCFCESKEYITFIFNCASTQLRRAVNKINKYTATFIVDYSSIFFCYYLLYMQCYYLTRLL